MGLPTEMSERGDSCSESLLGSAAQEDRRRRLELELVKIRSEARAARLDARAAEIELMIRELGDAGERREVAKLRSNPGFSNFPGPHLPDPPRSVAGVVDDRFDNWDQLRSVMPAIPAMPEPEVLPPDHDPPDEQHEQPRNRPSTDHVLPSALVSSQISGNAFHPPSGGSETSVRVSGEGAIGNSVHQAPPSNPFPKSRSSASTLPGEGEERCVETNAPTEEPREEEQPKNEPKSECHRCESPRKEGFDGQQDDPVSPESDAVLPDSGDALPKEDGRAALDSMAIITGGGISEVVAVDSALVAIESDEPAAEDSDSSRRKPAAWLLSLVVHVAALLILGAITLQIDRPRDQVALSASPTEASEVSMETFTLESNEPETEVAEPTPSETEYDLSPVGELAAADFTPEQPLDMPAPAHPASASSAAAAMSLQSDADAKIEFCGVEGGGNHFVYLVDSSGSMGDAFESARSELIRSIDFLKAEQRFYVVFFDAESEYMRLNDAKRDEPRSVYATAENKAALKRWAMRISMDRGRAPYDALRFALNLKPDVVFLLSDGEFPQGIEDLLKEENKIENLFGDRRPKCIVHTIGYHSKEGESRMRRIAQQNQGQYRYIPGP